MEMPLYKNKVWMQQQYLENKLSIDEVAQLAQCNWATIRKWLGKHHVPIRTKGEVNEIFLEEIKVDEGWLRQKYINEKFSMNEIAILLDCEIGIIRRRFKKFGIPIRDREQALEIKRKKYRIDRTGEKYGKLTIVGYGGLNKHGSNVWKCICECGNETSVPFHLLKAGHTKTCGCSHIYRKELKEVCFNALFRQYKNNAKSRDIAFNLTKQQFRKLTKGKCHYCGCRPRSKIHTHNKHNNDYYIYNGIDRIDNMGDYVPSNVVPCCKQCNYAKGEFSQTEFLSWINRIYECHIKEG